MNWMGGTNNRFKSGASRPTQYDRQREFFAQQRVNNLTDDISSSQQMHRNQVRPRPKRGSSVPVSSDKSSRGRTTHLALSTPTISTHLSNNQTTNRRRRNSNIIPDHSNVSMIASPSTNNNKRSSTLSLLSRVHSTPHHPIDLDRENVDPNANENNNKNLNKLVGSPNPSLFGNLPPVQSSSSSHVPTKLNPIQKNGMLTPSTSIDDIDEDDLYTTNCDDKEIITDLPPIHEPVLIPINSTSTSLPVDSTNTDSNSNPCSSQTDLFKPTIAIIELDHGDSDAEGGEPKSLPLNNQTSLHSTPPKDNSATKMPVTNPPVFATDVDLSSISLSVSHPKPDIAPVPNVLSIGSKSPPIILQSKSPLLPLTDSHHLLPPIKTPSLTNKSKTGTRRPTAGKPFKSYSMVPQDIFIKRPSANTPMLEPIFRHVNGFPQSSRRGRRKPVAIDLQRLQLAAKVCSQLDDAALQEHGEYDSIQDLPQQNPFQRQFQTIQQQREKFLKKRNPLAFGNQFIHNNNSIYPREATDEDNSGGHDGDQVSNSQHLKQDSQQHISAPNTTNCTDQRNGFMTQPPPLAQWSQFPKQQFKAESGQFSFGTGINPQWTQQSLGYGPPQTTDDHFRQLPPAHFGQFSSSIPPPIPKLNEPDQYGQQCVARVDSRPQEVATADLGLFPNNNRNLGANIPFPTAINPQEDEYEDYETVMTDIRPAYETLPEFDLHNSNIPLPTRTSPRPVPDSFQPHPQFAPPPPQMTYTTPITWGGPPPRTGGSFDGAQPHYNHNISYGQQAPNHFVPVQFYQQPYPDQRFHFGPQYLPFSPQPQPFEVNRYGHQPPQWTMPHPQLQPSFHYPPPHTGQRYQHQPDLGPQPFQVHPPYNLNQPQQSPRPDNGDNYHYQDQNRNSENNRDQ